MERGAYRTIDSFRETYPNELVAVVQCCLQCGICGSRSSAFFNLLALGSNRSRHGFCVRLVFVSLLWASASLASVTFSVLHCSPKTLPSFRFPHIRNGVLCVHHAYASSFPVWRNGVQLTPSLHEKPALLFYCLTSLLDMLLLPTSPCVRSIRSSLWNTL